MFEKSGATSWAMTMQGLVTKTFFVRNVGHNSYILALNMIIAKKCIATQIEIKGLILSCFLHTSLQNRLLPDCTIYMEKCTYF